MRGAPGGPDLLTALMGHGTGERRPTELQPERFRNLVYRHAASTRVRHFQAFPDPAVDHQSARWPSAEGRSAMARIENVNAPLYRVLWSAPSRATERLFPAGTITTEDLLVVFLPDELPIGQGDILMPIGKSDTDGIPDAPLFVDKITLYRGGPADGQQDRAAAGTLSIAGTAVTGAGTDFAGLLPGAVMRVRDEALLVASVASATALTLAAAPLAGDGSGLSYSVGRDLLRQPSAVAIEGVWKIVGGVPVAVSPTAYRLSADGTEVVWLSAAQSPAAGSSYAISYRYLPRYVVQNDLGMRPPTVRGQALPCAVLVRRAGGTIEG